MIDVDKIKKHTGLWVVSQKIEEMIYPIKVKFDSKDSPTGKKLAFVTKNQKKVCCPTHLIFTSEKRAKIYASIVFLKMYYEFDPFFVAEDVSEEILLDAYALVEKYEEEDPPMFLYYWMCEVPNR